MSSCEESLFLFSVAHGETFCWSTGRFSSKCFHFIFQKLLLLMKAWTEFIGRVHIVACRAETGEANAPVHPDSCYKQQPNSSLKLLFNSESPQLLFSRDDIHGWSLLSFEGSCFKICCLLMPCFCKLTLFWGQCVLAVLWVSIREDIFWPPHPICSFSV